VRDHVAEGFNDLMTISSITATPELLSTLTGKTFAEQLAIVLPGDIYKHARRRIRDANSKDGASANYLAIADGFDKSNPSIAALVRSVIVGLLPALLGSTEPEPTPEPTPEQVAYPDHAAPFKAAYLAQLSDDSATAAYMTEWERLREMMGEVEAIDLFWAYMAELPREQQSDVDPDGLMPGEQLPDVGSDVTTSEVEVAASSPEQVEVVAPTSDAAPKSDAPDPAAELRAELEAIAEQGVAAVIDRAVALVLLVGGGKAAPATRLSDDEMLAWIRAELIADPSAKRSALHAKHRTLGNSISNVRFGGLYNRVRAVIPGPAATAKADKPKSTGTRIAVSTDEMLTWIRAELVADPTAKQSTLHAKHRTQGDSISNVRFGGLYGQVRTEMDRAARANATDAAA
jgi:hypothetical protein